jgi:hypothetical protein
VSLKSAVSRLTMNSAAIDAEELTREVDEVSAHHLCDCKAGDLVTVLGTISSITVRPRGVALAFEAELYDGSGRVRLVWLGRRNIPGIVAGRRLVAAGRLTCPYGESPTLYNPTYTLKPRGDE